MSCARNMGPRRLLAIFGVMSVGVLCAAQELSEPDTPIVPPDEVLAALPPAVADIVRAPNPSAAIDAYARALAEGADRIGVEQVFIERIVALGAPQICTAQAEDVVRHVPDNGLAWAVLAFSAARDGDEIAALGHIVKAVRYEPRHPFVQRVAGQLMAWYDIVADVARIPAELREDIRGIRRVLGGQHEYARGYREARAYYGQTEEPAATEIPPVEREPVYIAPPYEYPVYTGPYYGYGGYTYPWYGYGGWGYPWYGYLGTSVIVAPSSHRHCRHRYFTDFGTYDRHRREVNRFRDIYYAGDSLRPRPGGRFGSSLEPVGRSVRTGRDVRGPRTTVDPPVVSRSTLPGHKPPATPGLKPPSNPGLKPPSSPGTKTPARPGLKRADVPKPSPAVRPSMRVQVPRSVAPPASSRRAVAPPRSRAGPTPRTR